MKYKFVILILCLLYGGIVTVKAQRAYLGTSGEAVLAIVEATGLPAKSVKSAKEVSGSKDTVTGILKRHTERSGNSGNPNVNDKVSPRFAVSPQDIALTGNSVQTDMNWLEASGWSADAGGNFNATATPASPATGCAAYRGPSGTDAPGTWRLPTQREAQLMWILNDKLKTLPGFATLSEQEYWTGTECSGNLAFAYHLSKGSIYKGGKASSSLRRVRCVRDL